LYLCAKNITIATKNSKVANIIIVRKTLASLSAIGTTNPRQPMLID